jgi:hypothetical protein
MHWRYELLKSVGPKKFILEQVLANYIRPVADDLRLLDLQLLAQHLSSGHIGNIESIVEASCELYFRDKSLKFCRLGSIELDWGVKPVVKIDLKFDFGGVTAAFLLVLDATHAGLDLSYMQCDGDLSADDQAALLERRLREARRSGSLNWPASLELIAH